MGPPSFVEPPSNSSPFLYAIFFASLPLLFAVRGKAVESFQRLNFRCIAVGDSFNDPRLIDVPIGKSVWSGPPVTRPVHPNSLLFHDGGFWSSSRNGGCLFRGVDQPAFFVLRGNSAPSFRGWSVYETGSKMGPTVGVQFLSQTHVGTFTHRWMHIALQLSSQKVC